MLTNLIVSNFKRFDTIEVELGNSVVLIGPNNSGKTSALQALALWTVGVKRWKEKRAGKKTPERRPGVTINRKDLIAAPVPTANLLWRNMHVRDVGKDKSGAQRTSNIRVDVIVEGVTENTKWKCGFEFDYANEESLYCRPLRLSDDKNPKRMPIPPEANTIEVVFLPPMSGLAANELRLDPGAISVRIGEGRTADVLRNLCHSLEQKDQEQWEKLCKHIEDLFGVTLDTPVYISERGEITMGYKERGVFLDLSSSGRGLQQTLLVLSYMYANPGAVLLLDEPDAHLEILRQRQIYQLLNDVALKNHNQLIAASHSEVFLDEAADRDVVVAFVGKPHRIDGRGSQVQKALREIGYDDYYQAEIKGWVLYLEGSTDLAILRAFAEVLDHEAASSELKMPFVHYVGSEINKARSHFFGLREAAKTLKGVGIFDRTDTTVEDDSERSGLVLKTWRRREIENYICMEETLVNFAQGYDAESAGPLFTKGEKASRIEAMERAIEKVSSALEQLGKGSPWGNDMKVSDEFLKPLFEQYYKSQGLPNLMRKGNFHELARFVPPNKIDPEIREKLDLVAKIALEAETAGV